MTKSRNYLGLTCFLVLLLTCWGRAFAASSDGSVDLPTDLPKDTLPLDSIKPGMKGYGLSVFSGFKVEKFDVEVIDVLRNFLPKQHLFLIKSKHPLLIKATTVGGMSGSPIFIEGKLAGALAYGWQFSSEPVYGVTPIADMLALTKRPTRGPDSPSYVMNKKNGALPLATAARPAAITAHPEKWWQLKLAEPKPVTASGATIEPLMIPLNAAGFTPAALQLLKESFAGLGFEPMQGGGTGQSEGPTNFEAGGAIAVQLVSGDMSLAGTGTVTWVGKKHVLAFGHRMFNAGELFLPTATARVNHTLMSLQRSMKIASPARPLGRLEQDRQAGIMIAREKTIDTIPMNIVMRQEGKLAREYHVQLAKHRQLTGALAASVLGAALGEGLPDIAHATFNITTKLQIKNQRSLKIIDQLYAPAGVGMTAMLFSQGLQAINKIYNNDFQPTAIDQIDMDIDVTYRNEVLEIIDVRTSSTVVKPGSRLSLQVVYQPFGGHEFTKNYELRIPAELADGIIVAEIASGLLAQPDLPPPETFEQYLRSFEQDYPGRSIVIGLQVPNTGLYVRGEKLRELPDSVFDSLHLGTNRRGVQDFKTIYRDVHPTQMLIVGKKNLRLRVKSEGPN